jgi:hypothetical protein
LLEYGAPKPELVSRLRELAWAIRSRPVSVIFLGARFPDIPELEKEVKVLDLPLPEEAETADILDRETDRLRANPSARVELDQEARVNLIQALLGLTVTEMKTCSPSRQCVTVASAPTRRGSSWTRSAI